jgi:hypothetical protein
MPLFVHVRSRSFWRPRGCGSRCCTHASAQAVASPRAPIACCPWLLLCCYTQLCRCTPSRHALAPHAIAFDQPATHALSCVALVMCLQGPGAAPLRRDHEASAVLQQLRQPSSQVHRIVCYSPTCILTFYRNAALTAAAPELSARRMAAPRIRCVRPRILASFRVPAHSSITPQFAPAHSFSSFQAPPPPRLLILQCYRSRGCLHTAPQFLFLKLHPVSRRGPTTPRLSDSATLSEPPLPAQPPAIVSCSRMPAFARLRLF